MSLLRQIGDQTVWMLWEAAPYLLLGLLLAGFVHVLLPGSSIRRWLGSDGFGSVIRAALVGLPLPVCSCGVVPLTVELRRKGASAPASLSFLTTTPESSIDSILLTWGLMGPAFALARPAAAFATALVAGALAMVYLRETAPMPAGAGDCCSETCAPTEPPSREKGLWHGLVRPALRYGFVELLDDLAFWMTVGLVVAGVVAAVLPAELGEYGLGGGLWPMLVLLAAGVPLYLCASSSTPVAAALLLKGVGPGAALVFLLAGPATNAATVVLLSRAIGWRFVRVYLVAVIATALTAGIAFELLVPADTIRIAGTGLAEHGEATALYAASFAILLALLVWRLWRGAFRRGIRELSAAVRAVLPPAARSTAR